MRTNWLAKGLLTVLAFFGCLLVSYPASGQTLWTGGGLGRSFEQVYQPAGSWELLSEVSIEEPLRASVSASGQGVADGGQWGWELGIARPIVLARMDDRDWNAGDLLRGESTAQIRQAVIGELQLWRRWGEGLGLSLGVNAWSASWQAWGAKSKYVYGDGAVVTKSYDGQVLSLWHNWVNAWCGLDWEPVQGSLVRIGVMPFPVGLVSDHHSLASPADTTEILAFSGVGGLLDIQWPLGEQLLLRLTGDGVIGARGPALRTKSQKSAEAITESFDGIYGAGYGQVQLALGWRL